VGREVEEGGAGKGEKARGEKRGNIGSVRKPR